MDKEQSSQQKAREHFQAAFDSIQEILQRINSDDDGVSEQASEEILHDSLSVERLSGYKIQLSWGGPEYWLEGELDEHGRPHTVCFYFRDWFTWPTMIELNLEEREVLLEYARHFYFGT